MISPSHLFNSVQQHYSKIIRNAIKMLFLPAHPPAANCIKWSFIGLCREPLEGSTTDAMVFSILYVYPFSVVS